MTKAAKTFENLGSVLFDQIFDEPPAAEMEPPPLPPAAAAVAEMLSELGCEPPAQFAAPVGEGCSCMAQYDNLPVATN